MARPPQMKVLADLSPKAQLFIEHYMANGRVAYKAYATSHPELAHLSDKTIRKRCCEWMKNNKGVQLALAEAEKRSVIRIEKALDKYAISKERIARELARIAFANATDIVSFGPDGTVIKDSEHLNEDERASIAEVKESRNKETGTIVSVKQYDKTAALIALGKHVGMFAEKVEHNHRHVSFTIVKD